VKKFFAISSHFPLTLQSGWNWHLVVGFAFQPVAVASQGQIPQPLLMRCCRSSGTN